MEKWSTETELAQLLIKRGHEKRSVRLTSQTAFYVGVRLMTADAKPTRDGVARLLCTSKCKDICYACAGTANRIVNVYGHSNRPEISEVQPDAANAPTDS